MTIPISITIVAGARPNFMKVAPIIRALESHDAVKTRLIHTGQHYDNNLSGVFFEELGIREPDVSFVCAGSTHGEQTASILQQTEQVLLSDIQSDQKPSAVLVVGDVNSSLASALAASKLHIPVVHVEAGLRSFDREMPEEINRIVVDHLSDYLFASESVALANLRAEGIGEARIHLVGNVMIDTLMQHRDAAIALPVLSNFDVHPRQFGLVTVHRPSNVDDAAVLHGIVESLVSISRSVPLVFPIHPRTRKQLLDFNLMDHLKRAEGLRTTNPLSYMSLLCLSAQAQFVITDSGGLQEETTALGVPCLTLRSNTERPSTVDQGTSVLIGSNFGMLDQEVKRILAGTFKKGRCPELWDGRTAGRIADILIRALRS